MAAGHSGASGAVDHILDQARITETAVTKDELQKAVEALDEDVKTEVQGDVDAVKAALEGDDDDAVKSAFEKLQQSQTKLGEAIYASAQAEAANGDSSAQADDDDVVDAEVIDDEDEKMN